MAVTAQFVHSRPQHEIASLLKARFARCRTAAVVAGFLTPDGVEALDVAEPAHAAKLSRLLIGAGTYQSFVAVDRLIAAGVTPSGVRVHLGHCRWSGGRRNPFHRYHPMLHSKLYLFEMDDGTASAFVGSHNMTGFALRGLKRRGRRAAGRPRFRPGFRRSAAAHRRGVLAGRPLRLVNEGGVYLVDEGIFDGLRAEANDAPRDSETKRTIVILAQSTGPVPAPDDVIYFEIDEALREIRSLDTDVHIHLFKTLPSSPSQALTQVQMASASLSCRTEGLEVGRGGLELDADWSIDDRKHPDLKPTTPPFRPRTSQGMQQVRVRVVAGLGARFEYLFDAGTHTWRPEFDEPYLDDGTGQLWHRVTGLFEDDVAGPEPLRTALLEASPESGSFILFSRRRRRIGDL